MFRKFMAMAVLLAALGGAQARADSYGHHQGGPMQKDSMNKNMAGEDFTGPYLGATVGYAWGDFDGDGTTGGAAFSDDPDLDGWQGGILGGYGFQFGQGYDYIWNGYIGLELGYEWSGADGSAGGIGVDKNDALLVTLRPGLSWGNRALGYGIIGYSRTEFDAGGEEEWLDGLVLGLGTELFTMGPLKTRAEYVFTNYEDHDFSPGGDTLSLDGQDHALKLGAVFRF